jgi:hypothetical protein
LSCHAPFNPTIRIRCGFIEIQGLGAPPSSAVSFVVKNFHDLLAGVTLRKTVFASAFPLLGNETLRDLIIDIGFKQGQAHWRIASVTIRFADRTVDAKVLKNVLKFVAEL